MPGDTEWDGATWAIANAKFTFQYPRRAVIPTSLCHDSRNAGSHCCEIFVDFQENHTGLDCPQVSLFHP